MKIVFDNSIHLGQFCINNEVTRIAAKNSQVLISQKNESGCIGLESFNENSFSDNIIWSLSREPQDIFYRFMDTYHSVKNVDRIPLDTEDAERALHIARDLKINFSNALTCTIAIREKANELHSLYADFKLEPVKTFLSAHNINLILPSAKKELSFAEEGLENYYQDALVCFKESGINLSAQFHK